jgi:hypothetical protein
MADPIQPVITALNVLATPNPPTADGATPPSTWSSQAATGTPLLNTIADLIQFLYGASSDMHTVGEDITKGLDEVIKVVNTLADKVFSIAAQSGSVEQALDGLQQALALAQTLLPGDSSPVLDSAGKLFKQIKDLLGAAPTIKHAAEELAQLGQLLALLKTKLKPNP